MSPDAGAAERSVLEIPVSRGARVARIALVLALDLGLLAAGAMMIVSHVNRRGTASASGARSTGTVATPEDSDGGVGGDGGPANPASAHVPAVGSVVAPAGQATSEDETAAAAPKGDASARPAPEPAGNPPGADQTTTPTPAADAGSASPRPGDSRPPNRADAASGRFAQPPADAAPPRGDPVDRDPVDDATGGTGGTGATDDDADGASRAVRRIVQRDYRLLAGCYEHVAKTLGAADPLEGKIDVRFVILTDGRTADVRPVGNTTGSDQLAECVSRVIEAWEFAPQPEEIEFVWPFVFRDSND